MKMIRPSALRAAYFITCMSAMLSVGDSVMAVQLQNNASLSLEERLRGEWRENNFDFDDHSDALTDDAWMLLRSRLGLEWHRLQLREWR